VSEVPRALTERRMMAESKDREDRRLAEQRWRELSAEDRESLRKVIRDTFAENPDFYSGPYEEVVLPEVVDKYVIKMLTRMQAEASARVEEHTTDEDLSQWMFEAWNLLPDDASEDMVMDKVMELMRRDRPEAMRSRWGRA
jgi:hypothetical protein